MPVSPADAAFLDRFIDSVEWRFAKTYVASYPHEYTLKRLCPPADHARVIALIEEHGVVEPFYAARRKYLYVGERKLWHMGDPASPDPAEHPDVINRTWLEVTRYREEARRLGYEGEALERLVALWPVLLERSRGAAAGGAPVSAPGGGEEPVVAPEGYAALVGGVRHEFAQLEARLPWKHNEPAPHEPWMPPHEYVLESWCDPFVYRALELIIRRHPESFDAYFRGYQRPMRYLEVGPRRYWPTAIGPKRFLNRCRLDSVEPPRRVDQGARPIPPEEWGASEPHWPQGFGYGEWRREAERWVFYREEGAER